MRQRFEFDQVAVETAGTSGDYHLKKLFEDRSRHGWQLVTAFQGRNTWDHVLYFQRPVIEGEATPTG